MNVHPARVDESRFSPAAEHAAVADRFAREIVRFLAVRVLRLRQLNGKPLARCHHSSRQIDTSVAIPDERMCDHRPSLK
jgi:hypothetical protein